MDLAELLAQANEGMLPGDKPLTARLVRFLISEGVIRNPAGRRHAAYDADSVSRFRFYREMSRLGVPLKKIASMLADGAVSAEVVPGFFMVACFDAITSPVDTGKAREAAENFARMVNAVLAREKELDNAA